MTVTLSVWMIPEPAPWHGWPSDPPVVEDGVVRITLTGESAILWLARTQGQNQRKLFDNHAGAILADRLEEYPGENDNPAAAAALARYLRRAFELTQQGLAY